MREGDYVVCIRDVDLYGVGKIVAVAGYDRFVVEFDGQRDQFGSHELELASFFFKGQREFKEAA
jgi:hypothetical protein